MSQCAVDSNRLRGDQTSVDVAVAPSEAPQVAQAASAGAIAVALIPEGTRLPSAGGQSTPPPPEDSPTPGAGSQSPPPGNGQNGQGGQGGDQGGPGAGLQPGNRNPTSGTGGN